MSDPGVSSNYPPPGGAPKSSWRGKRGELAKAIRHRWQKDWTVLISRRVKTRDHWRRIRLVLMALLIVGLVWLLVFNVLFKPEQTPLITIAATAYERPFPPNAWAQEDIAGLKLLDGQTLEVSDLSPEWTSQERGLHSLDDQLRALVRQGSASGQLILYLSMHAMVDGEGTPCLVAPGASPLKSETWLPVQQLLARIKAQNLPDDWHKLLIIDGNRQQVNWQLGLVYNSFADRLAEAVREANIPNLAVINSTSPGQVGWASAELQGSVFGHYVKLGLGGEADSTALGGDGDRKISLHELVAYLERRVDHWTQTNRAAAQRPMLVPSDAADFDLAWSPSRRWRRRYLETGPSEESAAPAVPPAELARLWRQHDELAAMEPHRFDPLAWRELEQKLLWLDAAARSGLGYAVAAQNLFDQLKTDLANIVARGAANGNANLLSRAENFAAHPAERPELPALHTLPLAEMFGDLKPGDATSIRTALGEFEKAPSQTTLSDILARYPVQRGGPALDEVHFLRELHRHLPQTAWQQPDLLRQAVHLHALAQSASTAGDERVQYTLRGAIAAGDAARRSAEDRLFVGSEAALAAAGDDWQRADALYRQAVSLAAEMSKALDTSDRAASEIPYLAQWLARPALGGEWPVLTETDQEIQQVLLPLLVGRRALAQSLASDQAEDKVAPGGTAWSELSADVAAKHKRLREVFLYQGNRLLKTEKLDPRALREIEAVLAVPLIPAEKREALRRLRDQLGLKLLPLGEELPDEDTDSAKLYPSATEYPERMVSRWSEHPAVAILQAHAPEVTAAPVTSNSRAARNPLATAEEYGQVVRRSLATLPMRLQSRSTRLSAGETPVGEPNSAASVPSERSQRSAADELVRNAASFWLPPLETNPTARLRQYDLSQLLLWQTQRALDDFWGPAGDHGVSLFDMAASDNLRAAKALSDSGRTVQNRSEALEQLLAERREAARSALAAKAADVVLVSESENVSLNVAVRGGPESSLRGLPPGEATVLVRDPGGRIEGTSRELPLGQLNDPAPPDANFQFDLPGDLLADRGPVLEAVAWYRGHQFGSSFLLRAAGGTTVDFQPYQYGPPKVTLNGRSRRRASIMFILDCSHSMNQASEIEGPDTGQSVSRLDVAKSALATMLNQLAEQGDNRVGVRFYGHRVGWNTAKPDQILRQNDYGRQIPETLTPSEDVELVLPLGRFDSVVAGGVLQLLPTLKPWGETPLYLALIQAQADFAKDDPDTEKTIVVITDGVNYQFNARTPRTWQDVLTARGDRKIRIDIVGFGIAPREAEQARREFTALTEQTGGSYVPATSATSLMQTLEGLLGPSLYTVLDAANREVGRTQVGNTIVVVPPPRRPQQYFVALDSLSTGLELAGGEAAELYVTRDGTDIKSVRFDRNDPQFAQLVEDSQPSGYLTAAHRPIWQDQGVRFPISFQQADGYFARRPAESWIEITPLAGAGSPTSHNYLFYDVNYEPDLPVPVLQWTARDWPVACKQAEIRAWCKMTPTRPDHIVKVADVLNAGVGGATLKGLAGVSYQVRVRRGQTSADPLRLAVVERHAAESAGLGSLKVEIYPPPQRIVRRFDAEHRLATHTFYFADADEQSIGGHELHFTTRASAQTGAWRVEDPIVVNITASDDVIRLVPATGAGVRNQESGVRRK